jgi:hypothetical protein
MCSSYLYLRTKQSLHQWERPLEDFMKRIPTDNVYTVSDSRDYVSYMRSPFELLKDLRRSNGLVIRFNARRALSSST